LLDGVVQSAKIAHPVQQAIGLSVDDRRIQIHVKFNTRIFVLAQRILGCRELDPRARIDSIDFKRAETILVFLAQLEEANLVIDGVLRDS